MTHQQSAERDEDYECCPNFVCFDYQHNGVGVGDQDAAFEGSGLRSLRSMHGLTTILRKDSVNMSRGTSGSPLIRINPRP